MMRIGVIGDIHGHFDAADVAYFNQAEEDILLFVGDLARHHSAAALAVAEQLAQLQKPALLIPGNHDAATLPQLLSEIVQNRFLLWLFHFGMARREEQLRAALGAVQMGGYSTHAVSADGRSLNIIVARPYAMGGSVLSFHRHLQQRFGIMDMRDSIAQLQQCVDAAEHEHILFLAHNGPFGLGAQPSSIWGKDFGKERGDFGDEDLAAAIAYARRRGKKVLAVVAGHMHHAVKSGGERPPFLFRHGTLYINAARVPRIFEKEGRQWRHHIRLTIDDQGVTAEEFFL